MRIKGIGKTLTFFLMAAMFASLYTSLVFAAERPQGMWDFNDRGAMPAGMQNFQNNLTLAPDLLGPSGMEGDYAFGWASCAGNNPPQGSIDRNNGEGVKICGVVPNDDTVPVVISYDFMLQNTDTMLVCLAAPQVEWRQFTSQVTVENGVITVGDQIVGSVEAGKWYKIGIVYYFTESGKETSVYLNGELKVENFADANRTEPSDIAIVAASKAESDGSSATARGEHLYIDNLYLGDDLSVLYPDFQIEISQPADGSERVDPAEQFILTFSDMLDPASVDANSFVLTDSMGQQVPLLTTEFSGDGLSVTITPAEPLAYSTQYILTLADSLCSVWGRPLTGQKQISFFTRSDFPFVLEDITVENGEQMNVSLTVHSQTDEIEKAVIVAGIYREKGEMRIMEQISVEEVIEDEQEVVFSFPGGDALDDSTLLKIFALRDLASGELLAEPYWEGLQPLEAEDGDAFAQIKEITAEERMITVRAQVQPSGGWSLCRITAANATADADDVLQYLLIEPVRSDPQTGEIVFGTEVVEEKGNYTCTVTPYKGTTVSESIEYNLETGCQLESLSVEGQKAEISGNLVSAKVSSSTDRSGMLLEFRLSDKAKLYHNETVLESGISRLDCTEDVTLVVESESGNREEYTLRVSKQSTTSGGSSGGGSSGGGGSSSSAAQRFELPASETEILTVPEPLVQETFRDVSQNHWAFEAVEALAQEGIVSGTDGENFLPDHTITREEFAAMLSRAVPLKAGNISYFFDDVDQDSWYYEPVGLLASCGVIRGVQPHWFGVGMPVSRQDMAVMIVRALDVSQIELNPKRETETFSDEAEIADYAKQAVETLFRAEMINGMEDGSFSPQSSATRAEVACVIYQMLQMIQKDIEIE